MEGIKWDLEVDALVVGSGAGGMAAALTAREEGLDVLLVEKTDRIGGSTAISGGALWIPLNAQSEGAGHPDTFEQVWTYLQQTVGAASSDAMKRAYLEAGPRMMDYLVERGHLQVAARTASPDYYPDRPGAAMGGRSLDPVEFDGRKLGAKFRELRDPLGIHRAGRHDGQHHRRAAPAARHPLVHRLAPQHEAGAALRRRPPRRPSSRHAAAAGQRAGGPAVPRPDPARHPLLAEHRRADAASRRQWPRAGLAVTRESKTLNIRARRGVVMATGGFPWDAKRREQTYPKPAGLWSMSPRDNAGDGIRLAEHAGAALGSGYASPAFWAPVSVLERPGQPPLHYPHLVWDRAKPGLIAVNAQGERFVNESTSYHEFVQAMQRSPADAVPAFLICGQRFIDTWGLGLALPGGRPRQHLIDAGYLLQAPTLAALAGRLGVPADKLQATVARHDAHAAQGQDPDFGKGGTAYNRYLGDPEHQPNPAWRRWATAPITR